MTPSMLDQALAQVSQATPLVFVADGRALQGGYHVTELQHLRIASVICSGARREWGEARLQLLDGWSSRAAPMSVGKFRDILRRAMHALDLPGDLPLRVESAPGHGALKVYRASLPMVQDGQVIVPLTATTTQCKAVSSSPVTSCCGVGAMTCCAA